MPSRAANAAIVGVGEAADFGRVPGRTSLRLNAEAALAALADAGLGVHDVDGVLTGYSLVEPHFMYSTVLCEYLGIHPRHHATTVAGGATAGVMVEQAAAAVAAGLCERCLVVYGDNRGSGIAIEGALGILAGVRDHPEFELPYGLPAAGPEAMIARRHMHEHGTTREQLSEVAVAMRRHALRNDKALRREPLEASDVVASRMVADPLHNLDCGLISNFGGAVVVTRTELAGDFPGPPVHVLGTSECHSHKYISQCADLTDVGLRVAADAAFQAAGVARSDIDVAGIYDGFTITLIVNLEGLGFCEMGEGGRFVQDGGVSLEGRLPTNTHGGILACAHGGILHLTEVANQLRNRCGERQVAGARLGLVHGDGASQSSHSILILGT